MNTEDTLNILVVGNGAMGKVVFSELTEAGHTGVVSRDMSDIKENNFDIIIDFSHIDNISKIEKFATENNIPVVIATTGFSDVQLDLIDSMSKKIPVLYSANYSLGVILMNKIVKQVTQVLSDSFDIEVIEKHHKHKLDSPSGTAKMLVSSIESALPEKYEHKYGREGFSRRKQKEIGIHSIRGGSFAGEHEIIFAGEDEVFSIKHEANSKKIFAQGAIFGAKWLVKQPKGRYNMENVLGNIN